MVITSDLKIYLEKEISEASIIWIASAMISYEGWQFLKDNIGSDVVQKYLIGIDLATAPYVFEDLLTQPEISAKVFESDNTYHPKVYLIQKKDNSYCAFVGSSNTTTGGLEKNTEVNIFITNQNECKDLLNWFEELYSKGKIITESFIEDYKAKFKRTKNRIVENKQDVTDVKEGLGKNDEQFFSYNNHAIFAERYWFIDNSNVLDLRTQVRERFIDLHNIIYPQFAGLGLHNLHAHYHSQDIVSRHYPGAFSGKSMHSMWLHYGKSFSEIGTYKEEEQKFIKHIRLQVIIHEKDIGIWLVLGKSWGSVKDREFFRNNMKDSSYRAIFFNHIKALGNSYWINTGNNTYDISGISNEQDLHQITQEELPENYFIIGKDIDYLDKALSNQNFSNTVLTEFQKLYPLYELMKDK